ncbi:MAG: asparagine synthase (glutamine-hydrolyzing) [Planctomycetes bacterium]|nr:asparagine synthase (glutamine-hydrolyzing) [Planctomycetota bacterium]
MCGIAGFAGQFEPELLGRMSMAMAHRGPDDEGKWHDPEAAIGLCHRRLSIIDLSPCGHQPMWDATRRAVIAYNGELYNYRELREELIKSGYKFQSKSDTEVFLNLYLRDGVAMLTKLNGIFAFAIWDTKDKSLFLARDGVGVKPLYISQTPKGFIFASEIKSLLQSNDVNRNLSPEAIHYHLSYLWSPAPTTILKDVEKLEPGYALIVKHCKVTKKWCFYDLPYDQEIIPITVKEAEEELRERLNQAVKRQMVADVPVGAFLSGGLDSSAVVAMARKYTDAEKLQCFTIGFKDNAGKWEGFAEDLPYAERVAKHLGVDLHTIKVGPEMSNKLPEMLYHLDEPQADPAPINALFISQLAREHNIKVLLSGAGGDDIFTGYRRHHALLLERYWRWLPKKVRAMMSRIAGKIPQGGYISRRFAKAFQYADLDADDRLASYFRWLTPSIQQQLYSKEMARQLASRDIQDPLVKSLSRLPESTSALNRMLYLEGKHFLPDHNLNYTDKMSMACGVEVRVPLLDPELVSWTSRLPLRFKQRGSCGKWIFKRAMEPLLPREVIYRPKTGFGAPLRRWLRDELREIVIDTLSERALNNRGIFNPAAVNKLLHNDRTGRIDAAYPIFQMVCIELWCRIFIDQKVPAI